MTPEKKVEQSKRAQVNDEVADLGMVKLHREGDRFVPGFLLDPQIRLLYEVTEKLKNADINERDLRNRALHRLNEKIDKPTRKTEAFRDETQGFAKQAGAASNTAIQAADTSSFWNQQSRMHGEISRENADRSEHGAQRSEAAFGDTVAILNHVEIFANQASEAAETVGKDKKAVEGLLNETRKSAAGAKTSETNAEAFAEQTKTNKETTEAIAGRIVFLRNEAEGFAGKSESEALRAGSALKGAQTAEINAKTSETNSATNAQKTETDKKAVETLLVEGRQIIVDAKLIKTDTEAAAGRATTSETNAKNSETNAEKSAKDAKTSETNSATSATEAKKAATQAATSEKNAKDSETHSANSATEAKDAATKAAVSEKNAKTSEVNSATNAQKTEADKKAVETLLVEGRRIIIDASQLKADTITAADRADDALVDTLQANQAQERRNQAQEIKNQAQEAKNKKLKKIVYGLAILGGVTFATSIAAIIIALTNHGGTVVEQKRVEQKPPTTTIATPRTSEAAGTPRLGVDVLNPPFKHIFAGQEYDIPGPAIIVGDVNSYDSDTTTGQIQVVPEEQEIQGVADNPGDIIYGYKKSDQQKIIENKVAEMKKVGGNGPSDPPSKVLILDEKGNIIKTY